MKNRRNNALLFLLLLLLLPLARESAAQSPESAQGSEVSERLALVIGNDLYRRTPLVNAVNDAKTMAEVLEELDFTVRLHVNVDQRAFDRAVDEFAGRLGPGDTAVFFYAGHGVQIEGVNYLIPIDFEASDAVEVKYRAYPADLLRERMEWAKTARNILILDACRDNPFRGTRSIGGGLAQMDTGRGTFVAFSTSPGRTAADAPAGRHSLFTRHLIETLRVPGLSLDEIFNEVRRKVYQDSAQRQLPWVSSSLIGEFYFRPEAPPLPDLRPPPVESALPPPPPSDALVFTKDSSNPFCRALEQILVACPQDFRDLVDSRAFGEARTFLDPRVAFPNAWYNQVFRIDSGRYQFLSSFRIAPGVDAEMRMAEHVSEVEDCLLPQVVTGQRRGPYSYRLEVKAEPGRCQIEIVVDGQDVDSKISGW